MQQIPKWHSQLQKLAYITNKRELAMQFRDNKTLQQDILDGISKCEQQLKTFNQNPESSLQKPEYSEEQLNRAKLIISGLSNFVHEFNEWNRIAAEKRLKTIQIDHNPRNIDIGKTPWSCEHDVIDERNLQYYADLEVHEIPKNKRPGDPEEVQIVDRKIAPNQKQKKTSKNSTKQSEKVSKKKQIELSEEKEQEKIYKQYTKMVLKDIDQSKKDY